MMSVKERKQVIHLVNWLMGEICYRKSEKYYRMWKNISTYENIFLDG
jgi:hypothetical protein